MARSRPITPRWSGQPCNFAHDHLRERMPRELSQSSQTLKRFIKRCAGQTTVRTWPPPLAVTGGRRAASDWGLLSAVVALGAERALRLLLDADDAPKSSICRAVDGDPDVRHREATALRQCGQRARRQRARARLGLACEIPCWARLLAHEQVVEEIVREF